MIIISDIALVRKQTVVKIYFRSISLQVKYELIICCRLTELQERLYRKLVSSVGVKQNVTDGKPTVMRFVRCFGECSQKT